LQREIQTRNIAQRASSPEIAQLLELFDAARGPDGIVTYRKFNMAGCQRWRDNMMLVVPDERGDYTFLNVGADISRTTALELEGRGACELPGDVALFVISAYDRARREMQPLVTFFQTEFAGHVSHWEQLVLPTRGTDGQPMLLAFVRRLGFREELLATLLDTSPNAIIVMRAQADKANSTIVAANRRAGELFGVQHDEMLGVPAAKLLRRFDGEQLWDMCLASMNDGATQRLELTIGGSQGDRWFAVSLTPVRTGLTATFVDITELKLANMALQSRAANLAIEVNRERAMAEALSLEIREREMRECELQRLAETDPLTGLKNRRAMEVAIPACLAQASIREQAVCFILCDLDHFKAVNDTYGHAAGDQTLFSVAERLSGRIRAATDVLARFGGEEFALCLPGADLRRALIIAEDLRRSISETDIITDDGRVFRITASFGVAECVDGESFGSIFARADEALYAAKSQGRNRVVVADHPLREGDAIKAA
jgi:diguanylate cyclase (GGDEF)-like protein/PAS domain S-box-containing protein